MPSAVLIGEASARALPLAKEAIEPAKPVLLHRVGDAQAFLPATATLQQAADLPSLAARAAAGALRLTQASAAAAYIEGPQGDPIFATAGEFSVP